SKSRDRQRPPGNPLLKRGGAAAASRARCPDARLLVGELASVPFGGSASDEGVHQAGSQGLLRACFGSLQHQLAGSEQTNGARQPHRPPPSRDEALLDLRKAQTNLG